MSFSSQSQQGLDYRPCQYGTTRLSFRGPLREPMGDFCVALGGSATYGRFLRAPWPLLLEESSGRMVLNLGVQHSGPDAYLGATDLMRIIQAADFRFLEVPGAVNLSNDFYTVHQRRNDRFLKAMPKLQRLYPEIDFTEFAFTRHMIGTLFERDLDRFSLVSEALARAWVARMQELLAMMDGPTVLLWIGDRGPMERDDRNPMTLGSPPLVSQQMLDALRPQIRGLKEVVVPDFFGGTMGKIYAPLDEFAARASPGLVPHAEAAQALMPWMRRLQPAID